MNELSWLISTTVKQCSKRKTHRVERRRPSLACCRLKKVLIVSTTYFVSFCSFHIWADTEPNEKQQQVSLPVTRLLSSVTRMSSQTVCVNLRHLKLLLLHWTVILDRLTLTFLFPLGSIILLALFSSFALSDKALHTLFQLTLPSLPPTGAIVFPLIRSASTILFFFKFNPVAQ